MEHKDMEKAFLQCLYQYPPDFDTAKELLKKGVNINAITSSDDETLLSDIIMDCEAFDPCAYCVSKDCDTCVDESPDIDTEKHYLLDIIKFCLDNGYNVNENNGRHGSEALRALCWSTYDKAILDAAKLLLDAGADPLCLDSEGDNVFGAINWKLAGCIPVNDNLEHECLFTALYDLVEASTTNSPYSGIQWCDAVYGKKIDRIYSCAATPEEAIFDFSTGENNYSNCFTSDIILECEGIPLAITHYCHAYVNPNKVPITPTQNSILSSLEGKQIKEITFSVKSVERNRTIRHGSCLQIIMDDGAVLCVQDNGDQFGEEYCARFYLK